MNTVQIWGRLLTARVPFIGGLLHRWAVRNLLRDGSREAVAILVESLLAGDRRADVTIIDGLRGLTDKSARWAVCKAWAGTRHPRLLGALRAWGEPVPGQEVISFLCNLELGHLAAVRGCRPENVSRLLALVNDTDLEIAGRAREVLQRLEDPAARETLCDRALQEDDRARELAVAASYAPEDPGKRALFFFLTDQWQAYENLDFDRRLLAEAYQSADTSLRSRITGQLRRAGRADWLDVLTSGWATSRDALSAGEWRLTLDVLRQHRAADKLWRFAHSAPAREAVEALRLLGEWGWRPERNGERFAHWARLAEVWQDPPDELPELHQDVLGGHARAVDCLAFSPDGRWLASASRDGPIRLWDLHESGPGLELHHLAGRPLCLAFTADSRGLATGHEDGRVCLWAFRESRLVWEHRRLGLAAWCLAVCPETGRVFAGHDKGVVRRCGSYRDDTLVPLMSDAWAVTCLALSPDGSRLAAGSRSGRVFFLTGRGDGWSLPSSGPWPGETQFILPTDWYRRTPKPVRAVRFSAFGGELAVFRDRETPVLRDMRLHEFLAPPPRPKEWVIWPEFRPDPRALAGTYRPNLALLPPLPDDLPRAARCDKARVKVWCPRDGQVLHVFRGHRSRIVSLVADPHTGLLASGDTRGEIRLWACQSHLAWISQRPLASLRVTDLQWVQRQLTGEEVTPAERPALAFLEAVLGWRFRHDVVVEEPARGPGTGPEDIFIEEAKRG
jgi:hypothetical protein